MPSSNTIQNKIEVWYTRCPVPTPFGLALHLGLLEQEFLGEDDIEIHALQQSSDPKIHQSHYTHTQKNSFRHGGSYPAIWAQSSGADIRVIGISSLPAGNTILTLPDSPISSVADLKGKRLLTLRRPKENIDYAYATLLRTYERALHSAGLRLNDVHLVEHVIDRAYIGERFQHGSPDYVSFRKGKTGLGRWDEQIAPLFRGEVDAIASGGLVSDQFEELLGLKVVFDSSSLPDRKDRSNNGSPLTFAVKAHLIEERPDIVARIYARSLEAYEWARHHVQETIRYTAREQSVPEKTVERTYGPGLIEGLETNLDPAKIEDLRTLKDFAFRHGIIPKDFNLDQWIDPRPLYAARELLKKRRNQPGFLGHPPEAGSEAKTSRLATPAPALCGVGA